MSYPTAINSDKDGEAERLQIRSAKRLMPKGKTKIPKPFSSRTSLGLGHNTESKTVDPAKFNFK
jgi:hypothetical protein